MDYATDYAQEKGKKYIWLSVWQKNKKAINSIERMVLEKMKLILL